MELDMDMEMAIEKTQPLECFQVCAVGASPNPRLVVDQGHLLHVPHQAMDVATLEGAVAVAVV